MAKFDQEILGIRAVAQIDSGTIADSLLNGFASIVKSGTGDYLLSYTDDEFLATDRSLVLATPKGTTEATVTTVEVNTPATTPPVNTLQVLVKDGAGSALDADVDVISYRLTTPEA